MTEERVTIPLLAWLQNHGWKIICYDFPQSGTGKCLHANESLRSGKNKGVIIPDIVAYRNGIVTVFENKNRYVASDFDKINSLRTHNNYSESFDRLLASYKVAKICYGVGLPLDSKIKKNIILNINKIDFAVLVDVKGNIDIEYDLNPTLA